MTLHDGINFGSYMQAYSLRSVIEQLGYEAQVIDYKSWGFTVREYLACLDPRCNPRWNAPLHLLKVCKFKKAHRQLSLTRRCYTQKQVGNLSFDRVVFGSDIVWDYQTDFIGYDPVYFSAGTNSDKLIAYAPSFGGVPKDEVLPGELRSLLDNFSSIAVRDENSVEIIKKNLGFEPPVVLDPTFLYDSSHKAVIPPLRDYILVYGYFDWGTIQKIKSFAEVKNKKLLSVSFDNSWWCDYSFRSLSPFEWLGYFANADVVFTTMFHGIVFSILNRKLCCFVNIKRNKSKVYKARFVLSQFGLLNCFVNEDDDFNKAFAVSHESYDNAMNVMDQLRVVSKDYLIKALQ